MPLLWNINHIPFQHQCRELLDKKYTMHRGRLTHVQLLFTWNPSQLQFSEITFEYLLLPPRSAAGSCYYQVYTTCIFTVPSIILLIIKIYAS